MLRSICSSQKSEFLTLNGEFQLEHPSKMDFIFVKSDEGQKELDFQDGRT